MRALREMIVKYKYEKYVKHPELFCQLDWWYANDAFIPNYTDKGNFKPKDMVFTNRMVFQCTAFK